MNRVKSECRMESEGYVNEGWWMKNDGWRMKDEGWRMESEGYVNEG